MRWLERRNKPRGAIKEILPEVVTEEETDVRNRLQTT